MKMKEVSRDEKFPNDPKEGSAEELPAQLMSTGPSETELVIVALLMRLYDLNLAILSNLDEARADEIYEAHEKGGHFNPPIFIPENPSDADQG